MPHAILNPNTDPRDQAAEALNAAIALYKAAGWTARELGETAEKIWPLVPTAEAPPVQVLSDEEHALIERARHALTAERIDEQLAANFAGDMRDMTDSEIDREIDEVSDRVAEEEEWLEALCAERRIRARRAGE